MRRALQRHRLLALPRDERRDLLLPCQLAQTLCTSPRNSAEAEHVTTGGSGSADGGGADIRFLQLLSQRFAPTVAGGEQQQQQQEGQPAARPLLATLPAAAQLMERAVPERPPTQPLYDIPNFLAVEHPEYGVHPRNPAYDWRTWARHNLRTKAAPGRARSSRTAASAATTAAAEAAGSTSSSRRGRTAAAVQQPGAAVEYDADAREQLALLLQMDQHMALPASREAILRMAELELAHLWYWQQQQQQGGGSRGVAVDGSGRQGHHQQQHSAEGRGEASPAAAPYASAPASSNGDSSSGPASSITSSVTTNTTTSSSSSSSRGKSESLSAADRAASSSSDDDEAGAQAAHAQATPEGEEDDGDDLWARVDATLKKRQEQAAGRAGQRPGAAGAEAAAGAGTAGGGGAGGVTLPGGHVLRPEVWSLLEAASRGHSGSGSVNVRGLSAFFSDYRLQQRGRDEGSAEQALRILHSFGYLRERRQKPPLAAMQLDPGSGSYWADTPELQYDSNTADYVIRQVNMMRRKEEAPADGRASMSAAIASLGAAARSPAAAPPATPMLSLLMDYLSVKYQDLLHTWELHARLQEAADAAARRAARGSATLTVQTTAPTLPPSLATLLERTWPAGNSNSDGDGSGSGRSDTGGLPWRDARGLMTAHGLQVAEAAGGSAVSEQDVRQQVAGAFGPLLERAAARHRALMAAGGGGGGAAGGTAAAGRGGVDWGSSGVVVFRETLTLDASSAYKDGSHDARVDLEFDVARLVALEPALGGAWGRSFLQRLMREGAADPAAGAAAGRQQGGGYAPRRRKVGPRAREAVLAAAYPITVETSYDDRTGTARLSTARYGSREANRKLLTEHFASLLRATAIAAGAGGAGAAAPAAAAAAT